MTTKLGEKIRDLRKKRGLTLDGLALLAGMSKSYVWELENRDSPRPSAEKLASLALHLGVPAGYLLEDDISEPEERHQDEVFFRNYNGLGKEDRDRLRRIAEALLRAP